KSNRFGYSHQSQILFSFCKENANMMTMHQGAPRLFRPNRNVALQGQCLARIDQYITSIVSLKDYSIEIP
ncbi:MAG: hypothetical protein KAT71_03075, partial [Gammaproteobacteria bacterium]|nr:hypothetical protein [Gammaproteobacteria bacterium]